MPWEDNTYVPCWKMNQSDAWNFSETLALFIADGLSHLIQMGHGCPMGFGRNAVLSLPHSPEATDAHENWLRALTNARDAFRAYSIDPDYVDLTDALAFLSANYTDLWD